MFAIVLSHSAKVPMQNQDLSTVQVLAFTKNLGLRLCAKCRPSCCCCFFFFFVVVVCFFFFCFFFVLFFVVVVVVVVFLFFWKLIFGYNDEQSHGRRQLGEHSFMVPLHHQRTLYCRDTTLSATTLSTNLRYTKMPQSRSKALLWYQKKRDYEQIQDNKRNKLNHRCRSKEGLQQNDRLGTVCRKITEGGGGMVVGLKPDLFAIDKTYGNRTTSLKEQTHSRSWRWWWLNQGSKSGQMRNLRFYSKAD